MTMPHSRWGEPGARGSPAAEVCRAAAAAERRRCRRPLLLPWWAARRSLGNSSHPTSLMRAPQSMHGSLRQRALATPKAQRPVGLHALARIGTPGHLALTFGRK